MNKQNLKYGKSPSKIRALFEYGKKRKQEVGDDNVYDFSIGNPSVPTPEIVNNTLISLLSSDDVNKTHSYTSSWGDLKAREAIAVYLSKTYSAKVSKDHIYITCGAAAGLTISLNALLEEGEEVILFAPYFPEYKVFIEHAKGKTIEVKPNPKTFEIDFNDFENKVNGKTKVVIINSPCNPTGVVYKEETIIKLSEILSKKEKEYGHPIYIISDEPYRELIYDDIKYPFITNYYKHSIVCYSFSKSLSLPGERIGYIALNEENEEANDLFYAICGAGRSLGFICAPSLFQNLIPHIMGVTSDISVYKKNRDLLYNGLKNIGYDAVYPDGAFYLFVKALEEDDERFSEVAKEYNLLLVPSKSFGYPGYVRVSYCVEEKVIKNSMKAFKELFERYQ